MKKKESHTGLSGEQESLIKLAYMDTELTQFKNICETIQQLFKEKELILTTIKMQKIIYILYGHLLQSGIDLNLDWEVWPNGPVCSVIYRYYQIDKGYNSKNVIEGEIESTLVLDKDHLIYKTLHRIIEERSSFSDFDFISEAHKEGTPWFKIAKKYRLIDKDGFFRKHKRGPKIISQEDIKKQFSRQGQKDGLSQ